MENAKYLRKEAIEDLRTAIQELAYSDHTQSSETRRAVGLIRMSLASLNKADKIESLAPVEIQTYYKTAAEGLEAAIGDAKSRGYEIDEDQSYLDNALLFHSTKEEGQSIRLGFDLYNGNKSAKGLSRKALHIQLYKMKECWELNHYIS